MTTDVAIRPTRALLSVSDKTGLEAFARGFCERHDWKARDLFTLLRVGATGRTAAPPLFDTLALLGKDRVRMRLREFIVALHAQPARA